MALQTYERSVHVKVPTATDIEIHVSQMETEWGTFGDIREYVVSLDQYGRGITFPIANAREIIAGLEFLL